MINPVNAHTTSIPQALKFRLRRWKTWCKYELLGRWLMQLPIPALAPWKRRTVVVERLGALGDVLLCTPALRRLKQLNPNCRVRVVTSFPDMLKGLPFIDDVCEYRDIPSEDFRKAISLGYEHAVPTKRHLARIIGDALGLRVSDVRPSCVVQPELVAHFKNEWSSLPRPWLVINRHAGPWTPNKDWPDGHWNELIGKLARRWTVIEIGAAGGNDRSGQVAVDLRGRTTRPELVAALAAADLHVGPISGPVHIAAAVGTPAVVIYGGYEHPSCSGYHNNVNLYSPVECASCWLRTPCPNNLVCLNVIAPQRVEQELERLWATRMSSANEIKPRCH